MRTGGWAAALAVAAGLGAMAAGPAQAACQLGQAVQYKVDIVGGQPLVEARVNGKPVRLIADLSSQKTFLSLAAAKALGLDVVHTSITEYGPGGSDQAYTARPHELTLGGATAKDVDLLVLDARALPDGVVGRLGRDYLTAMDVEFDLAHGAIRLFQPKGCYSDIMAYWGGPYVVAPFSLPGGYGRQEAYGFISIEARLNGKPIRAALGSSSLSLVATDTAARVGVKTNSPGVRPVGDAPGFGPHGRPSKIYAATFDSFSLGDETVKNAKLRIGDLFQADKRTFTGSNILRDPTNWPEMTLGSDFLYAHRVYIAWGQSKIYVSYLGGPPFGERIPSAPAVASGRQLTLP